MTDSAEKASKLQRLKDLARKAIGHGKKCCTAAKTFFQQTKTKLSTPLTDEQKKKREVWLFRIFLTSAIAMCVYLASLWNENAKKSAATLEAQGITNIATHGYKPEPTQCRLDEPFRLAFSGIKNGKPVNGVVCKNLLSQRRVTMDREP